MKVKIKKPVPGMAYFGGETPDLDPKTCAPWIESGHMVIVPETEGDENTLPEGLPYREVFFKEGLTLLEDVDSTSLRTRLVFSMPPAIHGLHVAWQQQLKRPNAQPVGSY